MKVEKEEMQEMEEGMEMQGLPEMQGVDVLIETLRKLPLEDIEKLRSALWLVGGKDINSPDYEGARPDFDDKYFFYKVDGEHRKVDIDSILYLEVKDNYVYLHYSSGRPIIIRSTLELLTREFPYDMFIKINRTYSVAAKYVTAWSKEYVRIGDLELPVSKTYYPLLEWRFEKFGTY